MQGSLSAMTAHLCVMNATCAAINADLSPQKLQHRQDVRQRVCNGAVGDRLLRDSTCLRIWAMSADNNGLGSASPHTQNQWQAVLGTRMQSIVVSLTSCSCNGG